MTRDYYDRNTAKFFKNTVYIDMTDLYKEFTSLLPEKGKVLDLGCGAGRDVLYFKEKGYLVTGVDNSPEIVKMAREYTKENIILADFTDLEFSNEFDGIWACASLLHINKDKLALVIEKILEYPRIKGIIYASFKYGNFQGIREGRYFSDFTENTFIKILAGINVKILKMWKTEDKRLRNDTIWLNILLEKI